MKIVRVTWNDAKDHDGTWVDESDARTFAEQDCEIVSVGFLISQTAKYVAIAGDWNRDNKDYGRVTKIPAGMVKSIDELG